MLNGGGNGGACGERGGLRVGVMARLRDLDLCGALLGITSGPRGVIGICFGNGVIGICFGNGLL
jgi:hypothetical protein